LDCIFDSHTFRHAEWQPGAAYQARQTEGNIEIFLGFRKGGATSWRTPE
jgi:hypothetical protein